MNEDDLNEALNSLLRNPGATVEDLGEARALVAQVSPDAIPALNEVYRMARSLRVLVAAMRCVPAEKMALKMLLQAASEGLNIPPQDLAIAATQMSGAMLLELPLVDDPPDVPKGDLN